MNAKTETNTNTNTKTQTAVMEETNIKDKNMEKHLMAMDGVKQEVNKAINAMRTSDKKKGESDARMILALVHMYYAGHDVVNQLYLPTGTRSDRAMTVLYGMGIAQLNKKGEGYVIKEDYADIKGRLVQQMLRVSVTVHGIIKLGLREQVTMADSGKKAGILSVPSVMLFTDEEIKESNFAKDSTWLIDGTKSQGATELKKVKSLTTVESVLATRLSIAKPQRTPAPKVQDFSAAMNFIRESIKGDKLSEARESELVSLLGMLLDKFGAVDKATGELDDGQVHVLFKAAANGTAKK